ncbi:MAG: TrkH family potassium uptake protein, partial [Burkholderiales bacterium]
MSWILSCLPLLGLIAMGMSLAHVVPIAISAALHDGVTWAFAVSLALNFSVGLGVWLATRRHQREIGIREGILLVVAVWSGGSLFATIPFLLTMPNISFTEAFFEA